MSIGTSIEEIRHVSTANYEFEYPDITLLAGFLDFSGLQNAIAEENLTFQDSYSSKIECFSLKAI